MYEKCRSTVLEQVPRDTVGSPSPEDFRMLQDIIRADDWQ